MEVVWTSTIDRDGDGPQGPSPALVGRFALAEFARFAIPGKSLFDDSFFSSLLVWTCRVAHQAAVTCPRTCVTNRIYPKVATIGIETVANREEAVEGATIEVEEITEEATFPASTLG